MKLPVKRKLGTLQMLDKADTEIKRLFINTEIYFIILKDAFHQEYHIIVTTHLIVFLKTIKTKQQNFTEEKFIIMCESLIHLFGLLRAKERKARKRGKEI